MQVKRPWPSENLLFFSLKDISKSIGLRIFRPNRFERYFYQSLFPYIIWAPKIFDVCTGLIIYKISANFLVQKNETLLLLPRYQDCLVKVDMLHICAFHMKHILFDVKCIINIKQLKLCRGSSYLRSYDDVFKKVRVHDLHNNSLQ